MKKLGMSGLDNALTVENFTADSWMMSDDDRHTALYQFCQKIVADNVHLPLNPVKSDNINDKVREHAMEVMSLGIIYLNYKDAIQYGDGGEDSDNLEVSLANFQGK